MMRAIAQGIAGQIRGSIKGRGERAFGSGKESLIHSMNEIAQADRYYDQRNIPQAVAYYQKSLTIIPFFMRGEIDYNSEFKAVISRLAKCYAWKGDLTNVELLTKKALAAAAKEQVDCGSELRLFSDTLNIIGRLQTPIYEPRNQTVRENFALILKKFDGKSQGIPGELIKPTKSEQAMANTVDLSPYLHSELRSSIAFMLTSLMAFPNFPSNSSYNKVCNTLLKSAEKSQHKNVIKALLLLITNLLRNRQYLQAEGMLQYCLDRKRENLKTALLKTNQEYILLQLLLAASFQGVQRGEESRRLREQFGGRFDKSAFLLQHYLLDSI